MWCAWWDEWLLWECGSAKSGRCLSFLFSSPFPIGDTRMVRWWRMYLWHVTFHSSWVLVVRERYLKLGEIVWLLWQTPKLFKNLKYVFSAQVLNACCCCASKTDTLLTPSWAGFGDEGGVGFWGVPFLRVLGVGVCGYSTAFIVFGYNMFVVLMLILKLQKGV